MQDVVELNYIMEGLLWVNCWMLTLAWVLRTDRVGLRQQGWLSNRALLVWTLAVLGLLTWAWLPLPISRVFLLQNLSGLEAVGIVRQIS